MEPSTTDRSVALVEHTNFAVSNRAGDIVPGTYHGFFVSDTRVLSELVLNLGGRPLDSLAVGGDERHASGTFYLANPPLSGVAPATISVVRTRTVGRDLRERFRLISHAMDPLDVEVAIQVAADFADIFEVRGRRRLRRQVERTVRERDVIFQYVAGGFRRETRVRLSRPATARGDVLTVAARLTHGQPWDLDVRITSRSDRPRQNGGTPAARTPMRADRDRVRAWRAGVADLPTDDSRLATAWRRAVRDIASLLLSGPGGHLMPAAGVPWYLAVFGRDAAITALQSLILGPEIGIGTLRQLGGYQGRVEDPWREEEPGKIPHEVRHGELSVTGHIPFGRYYGSVDATPLYLMLFAAVARTLETERGVGAGLPAELAPLLPTAERALAWIDRRVDTDGLLWYGSRRRVGIRNQVWKDSDDSMRYADGSIARGRIAATEVQGYVVAARRGMAEVFEREGRAREAAVQRDAAERLAQVIEDALWMSGEGIHALGIDGRMRPIDGIGTNAGHLLWSGAVTGQRAQSVADRLMAPDCFSGWGVRTLAATNPGYNPIGYHIGSVWPHDTSIVAAGMARAGQTVSARRVIDGLLDAAEASTPRGRLPELFAGFDRSEVPDLVPYPAACSPQAWASGAILLAAKVLGELDDARGRD